MARVPGRRRIMASQDSSRGTVTVESQNRPEHCYWQAHRSVRKDLCTKLDSSGERDCTPLYLGGQWSGLTLPPCRWMALGRGYNRVRGIRNPTKPFRLSPGGAASSVGRSPSTSSSPGWDPTASTPVIFSTYLGRERCGVFRAEWRWMRNGNHPLGRATTCLNGFQVSKRCIPVAGSGRLRCLSTVRLDPASQGHPNMPTYIGGQPTMNRKAGFQWTAAGQCLCGRCYPHHRRTFPTGKVRCRNAVTGQLTDTYLSSRTNNQTGP